MTYKFHLYKHNKRWQWRLITLSNNRVIGVSMAGYQNRAACVDNFFQVTGTSLQGEVPERGDDINMLVVRDDKATG